MWELVFRGLRRMRWRVPSLSSSPLHCHPRAIDRQRTTNAWGQVPSPKTSRAHRRAGRQSSKPTHATYFWSFFAIIRGGSACVSWSIRKLMARFLRSVIGVSFLETKFRGLACNVYSFKSDLIIACMCDNASVFVYDDDVIILRRLSNCHTHGSRIFYEHVLKEPMPTSLELGN